MKLRNIFTVLLVVLALSITASLPAGENTHDQKTCPVMGGKINTDVYADYEGKRVYFCCEACIGTFKQDPAKYVKKLEAEGVILKTVSSEDAHHDHGKKPCTDN